MAATRTIAINLVANDRIGFALKNLRKSLTETEKAFGDLGTDADTSLTKTDTKASKTSRVFSKMFSGIKSQGTEAFGVISSLGGSVFSNWITGLAAVGAALVALPAVAATATAGIVGALGGGLAAIGIAAAAQSKRVKKSFADTIGHVKKGLMEISKPFEATLIQISRRIRLTFDFFKPALDAAFKSMAPVINNFVSVFFKSLQKFRPVIKPITEAFNALVSSLGTALPAVMQSLADSIIIIADVVKKNPKLLPDLIVNVSRLVPALAKLLVSLTELFAALDGGKFVFDFYITMLGFWTKVFGFATAAVKKIKAAVAGIPGVFNKSKSAVMSLGSAVKNAFSSAFRGAKTAVLSALAAMASGTVRGVGKLISTVRGIPGKIKGALGGLGSLLWNSGRALINGLINGIKSALGALRSTLTGVTNLIPSWKGPLSLDKVLLTPAGEAIMGGLIRGITGQLPALRKTLGGVTSTIAAPGAGVGGMLPAMMPGAMGAAAPVVLEVRSGGSKMDDLLVEIIRKSVRARGGNVQTALGR